MTLALSRLCLKLQSIDEFAGVPEHGEIDR